MPYNTKIVLFPLPKFRFIIKTLCVCVCQCANVLLNPILNPVEILYVAITKVGLKGCDGMQ